MAKKPKRGEELKSNTSSKAIYFFVDEEKGINRRSKEVYKNGKIVHFPFGYDGGEKYKTVKKFVFTGFKNNSSIPVGILKSANFGYGFTKVLTPLMKIIEDHKIPITEVRVVKTGKTKLTNTSLTLTEKTLQRLHPIFQNTLDRHKQERLAQAKDNLNRLFPTQVQAQKKTYIKGSVNASLDNWSQDIGDFSAKDKDSIKDLFDQLSLTDNFWNSQTLLKTKQNIDQKYIEDVIDEFKKLLTQKSETATLEKKWQSFLGEHNWVFSYVFSFPVMLFQQEAYVGGKTISNKNGKVTDFLIINSVTQNVAILEIKTHKTPLIGSKKAYRGDDVFPVSKDVSGGINQVLDQRDNFQKSYVLHNTSSDEKFELLNPKCVVLMGTFSSLSEKERKSFELFRSNSKDVEVIAFDELLARFENLNDLMVTDSTKKAKKKKAKKKKAKKKKTKG